MTVFDIIFDSLEQIFYIMKQADFLYGISLWQLFILFLGLTDLTVIIKSIFGGSVTND